ncbi:helix-turn-helix transcriptional regulator [Streptomyces sp. NPDC048669]|uniref:helix-turn-helix domain-containing protein n=1 Tax=Streptomyces sp. NPDC048669 TaxID=3155267 RepID=UPI003428379E
MEEQLFATLHSAPSNEEIAARLHVSPRTVKFHLANIRAKLDGISRLRLCLLSALHRRGLRSLCRACAAVLPRAADASVAGAIPAGTSPPAQVSDTDSDSTSTFPARQLSVTGGETTDGP